MFSQLSQWFLHFLSKWRRNSLFDITNEDRDRMDIAYEEPLSRGDCEALLNNTEGDVVGVTAVITAGEKIQKTAGALPDG
jgi:hypothetical protein